MNDIFCFLGANTVHGFYSLYDSYISAKQPARLFILKGGAGCGKSGFLRRVAEAAKKQGLDTEYILCSGDPDSLDGVYVPARGLLLFDGTAPHILEPPQVGHLGFYLDLSRFYRPGVPPLRALEQRYKEHYRRAYLYLAAAGSVSAVVSVPDEVKASIRQRARSLITRELRQKGHERGEEMKWFSDAFSCLGSISLTETRASLCPRLITLTGGADAADVFLREALETALMRGYDVISNPSPLNPDILSHVLIPAAGLGFTVGSGTRKLHLDKQLRTADFAEWQSVRREAAAQQDSLLRKAQQALRLAKLSHDRLEAAVNPYIDFDGVSALAEDFIARELPETG